MKTFMLSLLKKAAKMILIIFGIVFVVGIATAVAIKSDGVDSYDVNITK